MIAAIRRLLEHFPTRNQAEALLEELQALRRVLVDIKNELNSFHALAHIRAIQDDKAKTWRGP